LTLFYYVPESFPKPIRAAAALSATPNAIASGVSYYLNLSIPAYESPWAVILSNLLGSIPTVYSFRKINQYLQNKKS